MALESIVNKASAKGAPDEEMVRIPLARVKQGQQLDEDVEGGCVLYGGVHATHLAYD